ncbi:endonuclease [Streptomyces phaeoluteigriseus]|uniref:Endonuclease n=1 Tax=Streptomyces phaeoluteigriseus TaxID=114686 RepID=A0A1V6MXQ3_9ACTN|nr:endonuclease [Streptomyces phaeoluteigriseus]OQD57220.1 endonuclease [Streptomyces phaeoluteigriseus]
MSDKQQHVIEELLSSYGRTYAQEAGIRLRNTPQPLYRTLVLAHLLSARIRASTAVATVRALYDAGMRDPRTMAEATWRQRVDALGRGGYRRYDERTATQLGAAAELLTERWGGDLRRLREEAGGDVSRLRRLVQEVTGIGPTGADIFLREVQSVWPEAAPYIDAKALEGARRLGLPDEPDQLVASARPTEPAALAAALVRAALDRKLVDEVLARAG